jgi:glucose-1-phosphate thymidylyltransferase
MKGIILAGGRATRLFPVTHTISKQLLPIYDRQMIFYPLNTLVKAGIEDILIIVNPTYAGQFISLLGPMFEGTGINLSFKVQTKPRGLADAFILGASFIGDDNVAMILGDNIFVEDLSYHFKNFQEGCKIFLKSVDNPSQYGIASFNAFDYIIDVVEKPAVFIGDKAITGVYLFDNNVINYAKKLKPSPRGELEIVDIIRRYMNRGELDYITLVDEWFDAGTFNDLLMAGILANQFELNKKFDPRIEKAIKEYNLY